TLAWAVSSTELSGTARSFASRRNAATSSSGILASCSPTPGTGSRVHRGSAVDPPARSTPRQNSRPRFAAVTVSGSRRLPSPMSHPPRRVPSPPCACRDLLSLHEKGVGGELRAVTHRHAGVDERADADRAAGTDAGAVGLEGAVFLRVALDLAPQIEDTLIPDGSESRVGDVDAVVEHPLADLNTHESPEQVLERRPVEKVEIIDRIYLPNALDLPEAGVVHGADVRRRRAQRFDGTHHQRVVDRRDHDAEREERRHQRVRKHIEELEGHQVDDRDQEDADPSCEEEDSDGSKVEAILCAEAAAERVPRPEMVESAVALDRSRNLEGRGAQQAHPLAKLAVERNHHLRPEE